MRGKTSPEMKQEAIRMRLEYRASYNEITSKIGISRSTLHNWLREYPLSSEEKSSRNHIATTKARIKSRKNRGVASKWFSLIDSSSFTRKRKAQIAEAAILFRLVLHGFEAFKAVFDGSRTDWLVTTPDGKSVKKIQVKWAATKRSGLAIFKITCSCGFKKYRTYFSDEYDAIVGYDLFTDTAYVLTPEDVGNRKNTVSVSDEYAERWDKLMK